MDLFHQFCCWTPVRLSCHWAYLRRGYWHNRNLIAWLIDKLAVKNSAKIFVLISLLSLLGVMVPNWRYQLQKYFKMALKDSWTSSFLSMTFQPLLEKGVNQNTTASTRLGNYLPPDTNILSLTASTTCLLPQILIRGVWNQRSPHWLNYRLFFMRSIVENQYTTCPTQQENIQQAVES